MSRLHLDFETFGTIDLRKVGVYRYAAHPETDVYMLAVKYNDSTTRLWIPLEYKCWLPDNHKLPLITTTELIYYLTLADVFVAHNANFERCIWREIMVKRKGFKDIPTNKWVCTAAKAAVVALPRKLESVGEVLNLPIQKDRDGHRLMLKWCKPRKPSKNNPATRWRDPEEFARLCRYCIQDVDTEHLVDEALKDLTEEEQDLWVLDQEINDRGVYIDLRAIQNLQDKVEQKNIWLKEEVKGLGITGIESPNQTKKIVEHLNTQGIETDTIDAEHLKEILKRDDMDAATKRLLEIRQLTSKTSVTKLETMKQMVGEDGRVRGSILYHGAATGRWAAKGLQLHNYPRTDFTEEDIQDVCDLSLFDLESQRGAVHYVVSQALRGMLRASPGYQLYDYDFSNIEGRLAAWVSGEEWKVDAFREFDRGHGVDIYLLAYARAFNMDPADVTKDQRQIGKTMELALGFQGWVGAFTAMASNFGIHFEEEHAAELCGLWRDAHPKIKNAWYTINDIALLALKKRKSYKFRNVVIGISGDFLRVRLPSGRLISYFHPYVAEKEHYGRLKEVIGYHGIHRFTRQWSTNCRTHGGDIFQSIVQGTARDCLVYALKNLKAAGFRIVMHVHDEILCEEKEDRFEEMKEITSRVPPWAPGLPMAVGGWTGTRFRK